MTETFREFFTRRNAVPFPGNTNGETIAMTMNRLADTLADWADEIAKRSAPMMVDDRDDPRIHLRFVPLATWDNSKQ